MAPANTSLQPRQHRAYSYGMYGTEYFAPARVSDHCTRHPSSCRAYSCKYGTARGEASWITDLLSHFVVISAPSCSKRSRHCKCPSSFPSAAAASAVMPPFAVARTTICRVTGSNQPKPYERETWAGGRWAVTSGTRAQSAKAIRT